MILRWAAVRRAWFWLWHEWLFVVIAVDFIKTLSTYLACSDGEYCYTGQQKPCSTCRRVCLTHFHSVSFSSVLRIHYVSPWEKKQSIPQAVPCCMECAAEWCRYSVPGWVEVSQEPSFFLYWFTLRVVSLHGCAYELQNRSLSSYLWKHGCAMDWIELMMAFSSRYKAKIIFCTWHA